MAIHSHRDAAVTSEQTTSASSPDRSIDGEPKDEENLGKISSKMSVPGITLRTIFMTVLVAMGGFIFGYDTGQISGFLEMDVFLKRFGQPTTVSTTNPSGYMFSNVRSGLIVGLVCTSISGCTIMRTPPSVVICS